METQKEYEMVSPEASYTGYLSVAGEASPSIKGEAPEPHVCNCGPDAPCQRDGVCRCALVRGFGEKLERAVAGA